MMPGRMERKTTAMIITWMYLFTRSAPIYPLQHNDIYVDDASLVVLGGGGAAPGAAGAAQVESGRLAIELSSNPSGS